MAHLPVKTQKIDSMEGSTLLNYFDEIHGGERDRIPVIQLIVQFLTLIPLNLLSSQVINYESLTHLFPNDHLFEKPILPEPCPDGFNEDIRQGHLIPLLGCTLVLVFLIEKLAVYGTFFSQKFRFSYIEIV